jgi:hypothetical protein
MTRVINLEGRRVGRLTVVERHPENTPKGGARWVCVCDCGASTVVRSRELVTGGTRSCGCLRVESTRGTGLANRRAVVKYEAVHRRMRIADSARNHACVDCSAGAAEWSYDKADPDELIDALGRTYSLDQGHYVARCIPCHRRYDRRTS